MLDEMSDVSLTNGGSEPDQCGVDFIGVSAKWQASEEKDDDTLKEVSFRVKPRQVLAVVGHVGSGKVSLFHSLVLKYFE